MSSQSRKFKKRVSLVLLVPLVSLLSGGHGFAEGCASRRDPLAHLARLANDPRLPMSSAARENLQLAALNVESRATTAPVAPPPLVEHEATEQMQAMGASLEALEAKVNEQETPDERANRVEKLEQIKQLLESLDQKIRTRFAEVENQLQVNSLPLVIRDRHREARDGYVARVSEVVGELKTARDSLNFNEIRAGLRAAAKLLRTSTAKRPEQTFDPSQLPFRSPEPVNSTPRSVQRQTQREERATTTSALETSLDASAAVLPPTPDDLAENEDVQITEEIRTLAASLDNHPLAIYTWVRNNIEFIPIYGSVQGSQFTLTAKRGNAFDIASLLIALLRAANVPARYVTGTIEVPATTVMNWVGGAATPVVAQQLLGQGGVPNVGVISEGTITHIRIDHVWVEAFVDYVPSRGAVHRVGDTWVPLDASFKLHTFVPPSDFLTAVPLAPVLSGDPPFDLDETLGKVTNINNDLFNERMTTWATQVDEYVMAKGINTPLSGFIGGSSIIQQTSTVFSGSLPYRVLTRGAVHSTLPATLRHAVTVTGFVVVLGVRASTSSFSVQLSLPQLNSRRLGLTFPPATGDDAAVLDAARNSGAPSLPVYLVNVVPSVRLDDSTLGAGTPVRMGSSLSVDVVLQGPPGSNKTTYQVVAGDEVVVGLTGNGVTREVLVKRLAAHPANNAAEYLHQVQLHYWMEATLFSDITAKGLDVHTVVLPSVGFFFSSLTVASFFGAPVSGIYQARFIDIQQSLLGVAGQDQAKKIAFLKQAGMLGSLLEGTVFDQLEGRTPAVIEGISAVHLISQAMDLNIPVYRITPQNKDAVLPLLLLSASVERDIDTAARQGKTVIVPESNLTDGPWSGVGYIIQDETTGAGAYRISGGFNGGGIIDCAGELIPIFVDVAIVVLAILLLLLLLIWALGSLVPIIILGGAAAAQTERSVVALVEGSDAARTYSYFLFILDVLALATMAPGE